MIEKIESNGTCEVRMSNGPIESINRKAKDLKRLSRGFKNFDHFRNRFLYATRSEPTHDGSPHASYSPTMSSSPK